jgi:uncharacterized membrane protein YeaQ/YmgE (transglycosylase-associated protein family)
MDLIGAMDFFTSADGVICLVVGIIAGVLAKQFLKGGGLGLIGNIVIGAVGAVVGGYLFDVINIIDVGDFEDPIIAGAVGAVILLAIVGSFGASPRPKKI